MLGSALNSLVQRLDNAARQAGRPSPAVLAVSKRQPAAAVAALAAAGQRAFGENYVQEATAKQAKLAGDPSMDAIAWHLRMREPNRRVIYLSAEKFMYQFIRALRFKDTMAFKEQFRSGSILPVFMHEAARRAIAYDSPGAEASWILEDNQAMRQPIEAFGGRVYRRWRIYDRQLSA